MADAADDMENGGVVARLFDGIDAPAGSMPQLRLMAALHELVLADGDASLAEFFPSVGGEQPPDDVWPVAHMALERDFDWVRERLRRPVQTNEPGRAVVLFAVTLWLHDRYRRPIRLLELGASAGLNLGFDAYRYEVDGHVLGDPASSVVFIEPWTPGPDLDRDLGRAAAALEISDRVGCDPWPRDPRDPADRVRLLSYIWPDELDRFRRLEAALTVAARAPMPVAAAKAGVWLPDQLGRARADELTVVWHSVVRQYVDDGEWVSLQDAFRNAVESAPAAPIAWVGMEPRDTRDSGVEVNLRTHPDEPARLLATCGDHGPPVVWEHHRMAPYTT